ncbi:MAG TPA: hydrolase [Syntrophobacteria bacterium]|nr:hydrolase [Syntrophobacteria bacterium]
MTSFTIDPKTSALVLIDLQKGITARTTAPRSSDVVVKNAARIAERFRTLAATVVLVHVAYSPDLRDMLFPEADAPFRTKDSPPLPKDWAEFVAEIGPRQGDLIVTKRQWGAFYGTDLDLQLRRRGIGTIVLGGIATNMGVESTARDAFERGYELIFVEDAMSSMTAEWHTFSVTQIFPRIGRVRSTEEVLAALGQA